MGTSSRGPGRQQIFGDLVELRQHAFTAALLAAKLLEVGEVELHLPVAGGVTGDALLVAAAHFHLAIHVLGHQRRKRVQSSPCISSSTPTGAAAVGRVRMRAAWATDDGGHQRFLVPHTQSGNSSTRLAMMLSCTSDVPPSMELPWSAASRG
jgi:hypothetical protein